MRHRGRRSGRRFAQGKKAVGICDRTGFKHLLRDLVKEPGTGLLVYKSWSDGEWNRVDHPQNFPAIAGEAIALRNPRPESGDRGRTIDSLQQDTTNDTILTENGELIYV